MRSLQHKQVEHLNTAHAAASRMITWVISRLVSNPLILSIFLPWNLELRTKKTTLRQGTIAAEGTSSLSLPTTLSGHPHVTF